MQDDSPRFDSAPQLPTESISSSAQPPAATLSTTPDSSAAAMDIDRELAAAIDGLDMNAVASMAAPSAAPTGVKAGDVVKGTVLSCNDREVLVDLGGKAHGVLPRDEFLPGYEPPAGSVINVLIDGVDEQAGVVKLSKKRADTLVLWRELKPGDEVEGIVSGMNKGGLEIAVKGIRGFIPSSQVDIHFIKDVTELFGRTVKCEVTQIDPANENLVLSRRKVLEREAAQAKGKMLEELQPGQVKRGRIRSVTDFGAFVDIGGVDGLLHVSDMSWGRLTKPGDVVKAGDEIDVQVLKIQKDKGKISLGIKQLRPNPWDSVGERFAAGQTIKGRVVRHAEFGAFVEIEPGVEGLVPLSELAWNRRVRHPKEIVQEGDVVDVVVLSVDQEKHRVSLSIKQVMEDPWAHVKDEYPPETKVMVKVLRLAEFGAFVEIRPGVEGMIHISEIAPQRVKTVGEVVQPGQEVEARVLRVDTVNHKIGLSLRPPPEPRAEEKPVAAVAAAVPAKKKPEKPRRGGISYEWDSGFAKLDPNKYKSG